MAPGGGSRNGTVQLVIDGNNVGSPVALLGGSANFDPVTTLIAGNHTVAVSYSGSSNHKSGSDSLTQDVTKADTTTTVLVSPSPSSEDQLVTITANVGAVAPGRRCGDRPGRLHRRRRPDRCRFAQPVLGRRQATLQTLGPDAGHPRDRGDLRR